MNGMKRSRCHGFERRQKMLNKLSEKKLDKCLKLSSWTRLHSFHFCNWVVIGTPVCEGGTRIKHLDVGAMTSAIKNQSVRCRSRLQAIIAVRRWENVWKLSNGIQEKTRPWFHCLLDDRWIKASDADVQFKSANCIHWVTPVLICRKLWW